MNSFRVVEIRILGLELGIFSTRMAFQSPLFVFNIIQSEMSVPYSSGCIHIFGTKSSEHNVHIRHNTVGRDSSVGIATRYGLYGPGIEAR